MRVRIFSPENPYPPVQGSHHVIVGQVEALRTLGHEVELVVLNQHASHLRRLWNLLTKKRAFGESYYYDARVEKYLHLPAVDLEVLHYSFSHPWLTRWPRNGARRVVHYHNLETELYEVRAREAPRGLKRALLRRNVELLARHELEILECVDEAWQVSQHDLGVLKMLAPTAPVALAAPVYSENVVELRWKRFEAYRARHPAAKVIAGFIGGMKFIPNRESALWILREVCPHLVGWTGEIHIAGGDIHPDVQREADRYPFVRLLGRPRDQEALEQFWESLSYFMIPHIVGSGVRTKGLEALASGIPTLANAGCTSRFDPRVLRHPLLHASEDPLVWAHTLRSESRAFATRSLGLGRSLESRAGMTAESVYQPLLNSTTRPPSPSVHSSDAHTADTPARRSTADTLDAVLPNGP